MVSLFAALPAIALSHGDAHACGGCFHPPPQPNEIESVVTDHRMVFSISTEQTVLWDQIRYSGDPTEFAWVLPVHPGARVELSNDAFLSALEASSDIVVSPPPTNCASPSSSGVGCGSSTSASGFSSASGGGDSFESDGGVQVISQSVVGPYESVTIRSSQGDALDAWLMANGFDVPPSMAPTLQQYTNEGFDFIALKLRPNTGIRAMQPVRVVSPGADASLPLRMVAAGAGAQIGLTLYVISEGRYRASNFPNVAVDLGQLRWDPTQVRSNYSELAESAMTSGDGRGWITEYAQQPDLTSYGYGGTGGYGGYGPNPALGATYAALCAPTAAQTTCADAGADDGGDAADPGDSASPPLCFPIAQCDDLAVATAGLHPSDIWVTRLRAHLPVAALSVGDLRLEAAPDQASVSNRIQTKEYTNPFYDPCAGSGGSKGGSCACTTAKDDGAISAWVVACATAVGVSAMLRRLRRRA